jgi:hypothetical protein
MERDEVVHETRRSRTVRPRDSERHRRGRVDALLGDPGERDQLVFDRQPKLESRRAQAKPEELFDLYCRMLT